jgi:hypothetical protein
MQVLFARPDDEEKTVVATVTWDGRDVSVQSDDPAVAETLARSYRKTPVALDDASYRRLGTAGSVVVSPGDLEWFRAATIARAASDAGLVPCFVAAPVAGGFDPAAGYGTFEAQIERLEARARTHD